MLMSAQIIWRDLGHSSASRATYQFYESIVLRENTDILLREKELSILLHFDFTNDVKVCTFHFSGSKHQHFCQK